MALPRFPSITAPDYGLDERLYKPQVRQEFEAGYVQSRPRFTRARRRWSLSWSSLPEIEYQALAAFFTEHQGSAFEWEHPRTHVIHVCRFSGDELPGTISRPGRRSVQCLMEEV